MEALFSASSLSKKETQKFKTESIKTFGKKAKMANTQTNKQKRYRMKLEGKRG